MATTYQQHTRADNGLAIAALVCGLVGILLFNYVLGPLAIIFGAVAWNRANHGADHKGLGIAGVILGIVDLLVFGAVLAFVSVHGGHAYWHIG